MDPHLGIDGVDRDHRLDVPRQLRLGSRPAPPGGGARPLGADRIPYLSGSEARQTFLRFFASKGHTVLPSYSLVPADDPSLLWINCGMAPLKPYFQGLAKPPNVRLATSQKSIRLNDIENVGRTPRHQTFFEMLGNFSIGEYFKAEAIEWAWELVTQHYRIPSSLLAVTVHPTDDEARRIWTGAIGLPDHRVFDDQSNFWDIGPGPCGPNSEIYVDRGPHLVRCPAPAGCGPLCECGRFVEFYNLVFTQYNHNEDGSRTPLPRQNIDTGMGLERMTAIVQGVASNFETDLLWPLVDGAAQLLGLGYGQDPAKDLGLRVIADHVRSVTFCIADGPLPSNEGRGYVIRRLLRRAARFGVAAGVSRPFLHQLVPVAAGLMADEYPEVAARAGYIAGVVQQEEARFGAAIGEGMRIAAELVQKAKDSGLGQLPGHHAFLLYDTFGFPLDLTEDLAQESGLGVDRAGFEQEMAGQRRRARAGRAEDAGWQSEAAAVAEALAGVPPAQFAGYEALSIETTVTGLVAAKGDQDPAGEAGAYVSLAATPFYPEAGGQVADTGHIISAGSGERLEITDVQRLTDGRVVHRVRGGVGGLRVGQAVLAAVDAGRRQAVSRNHTATHLLHRALKEVLGPAAHQAGSLVSPERLRFDFTYPEALTEEQLLEVERRACEAIWTCLPVTCYETTLVEARRAGAVALFGEKYGDTVRVVSAGDWTRELCGGTHVASTGQVGLLFILGESSIGSGMRRIEALTGHAAREALRGDRSRLGAAAAALRALPSEVPSRIDELQTRLRQAERDNEALRLRGARGGVDALAAAAREFGPGFRMAAGQLTAASIDELRQLSDLLRARLGPAGVGVVAAAIAGKAAFVVTAGPEVVQWGLRAGDIAKQVAAVAGGSGGGRPDMAQAGGRDPEKIGEALARLDDILGQLLNLGRKA